MHIVSYANFASTIPATQVVLLSDQSRIYHKFWHTDLPGQTLHCKSIQMYMQLVC